MTKRKKRKRKEQVVVDKHTQKKEIKTDNETVYTVVCCLEKSTDNFV